MLSGAKPRVPSRPLGESFAPFRVTEPDSVDPILAFAARPPAADQPPSGGLAFVAREFTRGRGSDRHKFWIY